MNQSVTVLMTTYNCAHYINLAIKSILIQTHKDFEFLIIDDGSIDETSVFVNQFKDKRIRYIKRNHFGRSASLNFGLENASNKIVALMDADDISHPKRLETQIKHLRSELNNVVLTNGAYFKEKRILYCTNIATDTQDFKKKLLLHGPYYHPTMMFHKEHILNNGGYNTKLFANEDHELWLKLRDISNFSVINPILYYYRFRVDSLSNTASRLEPSITYNIQEFYFKDLEKYFEIKSKSEINVLDGWREYFCGSLNKMRYKWSSVDINYWDYRMVVAYLISFLPKKIFNFIKMNKIRLRIEYFFKKIVDFNKIQREFYTLLFRLKN